MSKGQRNRDNQKQDRKSLQNQAAIPKQANQQAQVITEAFHGPIPHPAILEQYNKTVPGAADRIISMAEGEAKHRHEMEKLVVTSNDYREARIGQVFGFIIGITAIIGGVIVAASGHQIFGTIFGGVGIAGLVAVFMGSENKKPKIKSKLFSSGF